MSSKSFWNRTGIYSSQYDWAYRRSRWPWSWRLPQVQLPSQSHHHLLRNRQSPTQIVLTLGHQLQNKFTTSCFQFKRISFFSWAGVKTSTRRPFREKAIHLFGSDIETQAVQMGPVTEFTRYIQNPARVFMVPSATIPHREGGRKLHLVEPLEILFQGFCYLFGR